MGTGASFTLAGLADDKGQQRRGRGDLADGQGRAHTLLPILCNPDPTPTPLTAASPSAQSLLDAGGKGEQGFCTTTHSLLILKPGQGGNRVQPKAAPPAAT